MPKKIRQILEEEVFYNNLNNLLTSYCEDKITLAEQLDLADAINTECKRILSEIPLSILPHERDGMGIFLQKLAIYTEQNIQEILNTKNQIDIKSMLLERRKKRSIDPEYIPSKKVKTGILKSVDPSAAKTATISKFRSLAIKALLVKKNRARKVNKRSKKLDLKKTTKKLSATQRSIHRVVIIDGKFCKRKFGIDLKSPKWLSRGDIDSRYKTFTTYGMQSHQKSRYGAYTLNMYGELSVFNHYGMVDRVAHSTMNAGASVISAGEIKISPDGQLERLTVHSGHYHPGPLQIYNTLKYFKEQGIDISKAEVRFFHNLRSYGIKSDYTRLSGNYLNKMYNAKDLYEEIEEILSSKDSDKIDRLEAKGRYKTIKKVHDKFNNIMNELEKLDEELTSTKQDEKLSYLKKMVRTYDKQIANKKKESGLSRFMFNISGGMKKLVKAKDKVQSSIDMQIEMRQAVKSIRTQAYQYQVSGWLDVEEAIEQSCKLPKFIKSIIEDLDEYSSKYADLPTMNIPKSIQVTMDKISELDKDIKSTIGYRN